MTTGLLVKPLLDLERVLKIQTTAHGCNGKT